MLIYFLIRGPDAVIFVLLVKTKLSKKRPVIARILSFKGDAKLN